MKMLTTASQSNAQLRKIKKPLIERRRRERINDSLCQLKTLVLEATNRDESCYSKMEKADILEMTVSHLRSVQRHPASSPTSSAVAVTSSNRDDAVQRYLFGFNECAKEVARYLTGVEELAGSVVTGLMKHLTLRFGSFHRIPEAQQLSSKQLLYSSEVDENSNLLVTSPVRRLVPEASESIHRPSLTSLNRDSFCEVVSLSVSTSSNVFFSPNCRGASVAAKCSAREPCSGATGSVEQKEAEVTRSKEESLYFSADDRRGTTQQRLLNNASSAIVVSLQENHPFALTTKKKKSHSDNSWSSSVATSTSSAVIPVMSTEVESTVKNEILLSGAAVWRPW